jgi:serine/threonine protein kinase
MGEVYSAKDTKLGREVAIKVMPVALAQDAERLAAAAPGSAPESSDPANSPTLTRGARQAARAGMIMHNRSSIP